MTYLDPTYREQTGPDADTGRRQSQLLESYLNNAWISWTPVLTGSSVNPNPGSTFTVNGQYKRLGSVCFGRANLTWNGTGITQGTGDYYVTLPFASARSDNPYVGTWNTYHSGNHGTGSVQVFSTTSQVRLTYAAAWAAGTETHLGASTPWVWAATDNLDIQFCYEVGK